MTCAISVVLDILRNGKFIHSNLKQQALFYFYKIKEKLFQKLA